MGIDYAASIDRSAIADGPTNKVDANDVLIPFGNIETILENLVNGVDPFRNFKVDADTTLTLDASGNVTRTRVWHTIDTFGGAANDRLVQVLGGSEGMLLIIGITAIGRTVTIESGFGANTLALGNGREFTLTTTYQRLIFKHDGSQWIELFGGSIGLQTVNGSVYKSARSLVFPDNTVRVADTTTENAATLSIMPDPIAQGFFMERAAAATIESVGMAAGTNAGAGTVTNANAADGAFVSQAIAATANTFGGRKSTTFNLVRRQWQPTLWHVFKTPSVITNLRIWIGMAQAMFTNVDTLAAGSAGYYLRYSSVAPDTNWMLIANDGTNQSTAVDTGVAVAVDTLYTIRLRISSSGWCYASINGSSEVSVSNNLPSASQDLGYVAAAVIPATAGSPKSYIFGKLWCHFNG